MDWDNERIRDEVKAFLVGSTPTVSCEKLMQLKREMGLNGYETNALLQKMDLAGLVKYAKLLYKHGDIREYSPNEVPDTYAEVITGRVLPLIIQKLEDQHGALNEHS